MNGSEEVKKCKWRYMLTGFALRCLFSSDGSLVELLPISEDEQTIEVGTKTRWEWN